MPRPHHLRGGGHFEAPRFSKIMAGHIPDSEHMTIPGCGHAAIFEKPKELESAVPGFIIKNTDLGGS